MGKFLERGKLPKLNQERTNKLNSPISKKETKVLVKDLPTKKIPGPSGYTSEFYQILQQYTQKGFIFIPWSYLYTPCQVAQLATWNSYN